MVHLALSVIRRRGWAGTKGCGRLFHPFASMTWIRL
jgi:hypothetical protein